MRTVFSSRNKILAVGYHGCMPASTNARSRVRAQLTAEIKDAARAELAIAGPSGLSLRAVARRLEMVPSGLYRYFDSRDALLTALILDAYGDLASAVEATDGRSGRAPMRRWLALGHAIRDWALAHPHEWGLLHGAPVPGYHAPDDTVDAALAPIRIFAGILRPVHARAPGPATTASSPPSTAGVVTRSSGLPPLPVTPPLGRDLRDWIGRIREPYLVGLPDQVIAAAVVAYSQLIGAVSFELFGQYGPEASPAPAIFEHGLRLSAGLLGLPGAR
jgi:AcrR family transcriptional regulator